VIAAERAKVELVGDPALMDPAAPRGAVVAITLADGRTVEHHTRHPPGTKENPLSTEAVNAKARDLMTPVLGPDAAERLIARVNALEAVADMRELRPLLAA
jgi:2-methylcitrate dehydratase PrpD